MSPSKILIVRLSAVGDVIQSVPVACALRRHYPDAHISWIVQRGAAPLLKGHPAIDELITTPKISIRRPSELSMALRKVRAVNPDISIDIQGLLKTSILAFRSGAAKRIGFQHSEFEGRECSTWLNNIIVTPKHKQVVLRNLELLGPLGCTDPIVEYNFPETEADSQYADDLQTTLFHGSPFGIINVGAGWVSKLWPSERYGAVAKHLFRKHGLPTLVVWGTPAEEVIAREVVAYGTSSAKLAPFTTLTQLRSILKRGKIFVGSDTGPMHLSSALGTPTVAMIGPMPGERVGPIGPFDRCVQNLRLATENRHERRESMEPMLSISPELVFEAIDSVMEQLARFHRGV